MNKGQKVLAGLLAVVAVELLPVSVIATRAIMGGYEVTYEVDDEQLSELEAEMGAARDAAMDDMKEEGKR